MKDHIPQEKSLIEITTTQELLLSVIKSKRLYGLEISREISLATDKKRNIPVGSLYSILRRLENKGLIKSQWGKDEDEIEKRGGARRRYYELTGLGQKTLEETQLIRSAVYAWVTP
ncbi:MAG: PadR family transcriptional regulator [Cyanobacteria bacterium P01_F01_bin.86]